EMDPFWPDRANVEFARIISPGLIKVRVWERGSGETMACGTGACGTAAAAMVTGRSGRHTTVALPGGRLEIDIDPDTMEVTMTGPAATSFEGSVKLDFESTH
ncbi:MAG: diaminopimelate epimerase, partial [Muribaculaceae bacterium]|nr:diaminopimelate epimerase [Muribaculaceae bacterium]